LLALSLKFRTQITNTASPSCAQVKITGGGNGTPGPMVKFPGAYKKTDPSFNFSIYGGIKPYPMPGPAVWVGGSSAGSGNSTTPVSEQPTQQPTQQPTPVQSATAKPTSTKVATTKPTSTPTASPGAGGEGPKGCGRRHARAFK
jgi:hypothetical protein